MAATFAAYIAAHYYFTLLLKVHLAFISGEIIGSGPVGQLKMVGQCCDNEDELTELNQKALVLHACEYCWSCIFSSRG